LAPNAPKAGVLAEVGADVALADSAGDDAGADKSAAALGSPDFTGSDMFLWVETGDLP